MLKTKKKRYSQYYIKDFNPKDFLIKFCEYVSLAVRSFTAGN